MGRPFKGASLEDVLPSLSMKKGQGIPTSVLDIPGMAPGCRDSLRVFKKRVQIKLCSGVATVRMADPKRPKFSISQT